MPVSADREIRATPVRVVLVGTGTGVGKTHVACALVAEWAKSTRVVGLKPIETGIVAVQGSRHLGESDQAHLTSAAQVFHVKRGRDSVARGVAPREAAPRELPGESRSFHVKRSANAPQHPEGRARSNAARGPLPEASLYTFPEPVSPHLAARNAGVRIDLGLIERWVEEYEAPVTLVETAGGLFSPLGHGSTNFELARALHPDAVVLVAPDRLGVLHELTTTLALTAARGGLPLGIVLSAPEVSDASTGSNAGELEALGIGSPIATFPRKPMRDAATQAEARTVITWVARLAGRAS